MERRDFLKLLGLVPLVPYLPSRSWSAAEEKERIFGEPSSVKAKTWRPVLYGDGKHDDTYALQALLDGRRDVVRPDGAPVAGLYVHGLYGLAPGKVVLPTGTYRVTDTVHVNATHFDANNSKLIGEGANPVLRWTPEHHGTFSNLWVESLTPIPRDGYLARFDQLPS